MQILSLKQGSPEWLAMRLDCISASEVPIIMGVSPFMSRDDLLKYKTTKDEKEISRFQQMIYDNGHEVEAMARPLAEIRLFDGDDLYPIVGLKQYEGVKFLASFDGLVMPAQNEAWEHKQFNQALYDLVKSTESLEPKHYWQLEAQAFVGDLDKVTFTVSDGTSEKCADRVYVPYPERRREMIAHVKQFVKDLENYVPIVVPPKAIAELVETLPAFTYRTEFTPKGLVIHSNLDEYKAACVALVERSKQKLETDQDFANAENRVKLCKEAEDRITHLQKLLLSEVTDVDKTSRDLEAIKEMLRQCRLNEDKQVTQQKDKLRLDIVTASKAALDVHMKAANSALATHGLTFGAITMPEIKADFATAMKGKRTIKTLQEAANTELARAKVEAGKVADLIDQNLLMMAKTANDYPFLFADIRQLITKETEDLKAIAINRIAEHKAAEQEKIAAAVKKIDEEKSAVLPAAEIVTTRVFGGGSPAGSGISKGLQGSKEIQEHLFGEEFIDGLSAMDEYFSGSVSSPVVDVNTGKPTVLTRENILIAVGKYWGVLPEEALQACVEAFGG